MAHAAVHLAEDTPHAPGAQSHASTVVVRANPTSRLAIAARIARAASPARPAPELRTERLLLRPLQRSDRAEFLRVLRLSEAHLARFCPLGSHPRDDHHARESHESIFERQLALSDGALATGRAWRMSAFDLATGRLVGAFNINDIARGLEHTGELVFWLSADATRRGFAVEAVRATLEHAFRDIPSGLGLHHVTALIAPDNDACRALAREVGLSLSPDAPRIELMLEGRRTPHDVYERFATIPGAPAPAPPPSPIASVRARQGRVVEAKPSVGESIFGRGLLTILRTEGLPTPAQAEAAPDA